MKLGKFLWLYSVIARILLSKFSARTGIALAIGSFGALGAAPAQGALLTDAYLWHRAIIFSGVRYLLLIILHYYSKYSFQVMLFASFVSVVVVRILLVKERGTQRV